ncbi:hypothetical protein I656_01292 [Geobacillus sp. WSUCF1]|nr:hypothetical protein I656_01292 [Geobacillus sp. WSUCF1]
MYSGASGAFFRSRRPAGFLFAKGTGKVKNKSAALVSVRRKG